MTSPLIQSYSMLVLVAVTIALPVGMAQAQVAADGTLPTTVSSPDSRNFTIDQGARSGSNLFHSFSQFSVPTSGSAIFNNALDVQNIFSRVTGSQVSNIDGILKTQGNANLFLINPNGIIFGPNASLNIGGSLTATTADSVMFADGVKFNATETTTPALLTVSVPVGLSMGANASSITVRGPVAPNSFFRPPTLSLNPNQTLALVGGQITVDSATLSAPDGQIELWAVQNAEVAINNPMPWQLTSPASTANWGNVTLQNFSLVDASGSNGGAINIRGRGLTLKDGSNITSKTFAGQGKGITVQTTDFVDLLGNPIITPKSGFDGINTSVGNVFGIFVLPGPPATGRAGDIAITTGRLSMANGGLLQSVAAGDNSSAGDVTIRATDVNMMGYEASPGFAIAAISSSILAGNNNQGGQVSIEGQRIRILDGGRISSSVIGGNGKAGGVSIQAIESLEIRGSDPVFGVSSAVLASMEAGTTGQGGQIKINAGHLTLANGGSITSAVAGTQQYFSFGLLPGAQGTAGSIDIRAREVEVSDPIIDGYSQTITGITASLGNGAIGSGGSINLTANSLKVFNGGQITSSSQGQGHAGNVNLNVNAIDVQGTSQSLVNGQFLPSSITAASSTIFNAGSVNINADTVNVRDSAQIAVSNTGTGNAGNLNVNSRSIFLNNGASFRADVNGGTQGNINLQARDILLLRNDSNITTNAQGSATGGNITIDSPIIVGFGNSDIIANALKGKGGNIQISTQGIFGLKYRDRLTTENDITASSEFGINGNVQVNTIGVNPNSGLVTLPVEPIDPSQKIATGCGSAQNSSFIVTGRGGTANNPSERLVIDRSWSDLSPVDVAAQPSSGTPTALIPPAALQEAITWTTNAQGQPELIAGGAIAAHSGTTCTGRSSI